MEPKIPTILNSRGEPIVLNDREKASVEEIGPKYQSALKKFGVRNALGYEITLTSLTTIMKKITEQKFFQIAPADYLPVRVGEGAWSSNLVTYREYEIAGDFAASIIDTGGNNARLASTEVGVDSLSIPVQNWVRSLGWSIFDLELAAKSGNWDIVSAKERARKRRWDLGIQQTAFLGVFGRTNCNGLLTLPTIAITPGVVTPNATNDRVSLDTTTLTAPITSLATTPSTLSAFVAKILNVYRANCQRTSWPTHFILPESDFLGLATASSPDFPLKSILEYMMDTLRTMTGNKNFKVLPCVYADGKYGQQLGQGGNPQQTYMLLNYDEEAIRMDIPVDYTNTLANSLDNFSFQNAAYGQFTGVLAYRNLEAYYMRFPS